MLVDRIIGAFTFRKGVYSEVEKDEAFTTTAWVLVAVAAFLNQLGSSAVGGFSAPVRWLLSAIVWTVVSVIGFAVAAYLISVLGKTLFSAEVTFGETVRTLGLAYIWNAVGFLAIVGAISAVLLCVVSPVTIIAAILGFAAWLVAAKEALDLDWGKTLVVIIVGIVVYFAVLLVAGIIVGILGLGAGMVGGLFSS
jgi:hypothetical protein